MSLEEVSDKLNKIILLNKKIPEDLRMSQTGKLIPDRKKVFSKERERIITKLEGGGYGSSRELRKDLEAIGFDLNWSSITNTRMAGLDFSSVNFSVADLSGSDFSGCSLSGADFSIAKIVNTRFQTASMQSADLSMVDCSGADFSGADLSASSFVSCLAVGASFSGANLSNCDFSGSNLRNADFQGANTTGIILKDCDLRGTIFEGLEEGPRKKERKYQEAVKEIYENAEEVREYIAGESAYSSETTYKQKGEYR